MSATTFVVGDRVRRKAGLGDREFKPDMVFRVRALVGSSSIDIVDDVTGQPFDPNGYGSEWLAENFEKVAPAASVTTRLFKQGDRVRVVSVNPSSWLTLQHKARVGDVFVVEKDQPFPSSDVHINGWGCEANQFELAESAVEYVRTPDGVVAPVEEVTAGGAKLVAGVYYDPARLTAAEAPKPLPDVPTDADTMLRMVDRFLSRGDNEARRLQHVLAALRGPDEAGVNKAATTGVIRSVALPETKKLGGDVNMSFRTETLDMHTQGGSHFGGHIQSAVEALRAMGREVK
jgi:hypothetical protein